LTGPDANLREEALRSLVKSEGEWATVALGEIYDKSRDLSLRRNLIDYLGQRKAMSKLMELAVAEPNEQLRQLAAQRLLDMEGDGVADMLVDLYGRAHDKELRENIIRSFGRRGEIDRLAMVGDMEKDMENNQELIRLNLDQLEWMAANHESTDTRRKADEWLAMRRRQASGKDQHTPDYPPPPPPPPPAPAPSLRMLNDSTEAERMLRQEPNESTIVIALLRECLDAQTRQDTAFLERLLAEDFQGIGPDGVVYNKARAIAKIKSQDIQFKKFEIDDFRLRGKEPSLVTNFLCTAYYEEDGQTKNMHFYCTVNFLKRQGGWEIISIHQSMSR
ncbi:MAG: nuclear transport factor 2 family protein, partial [Acidobacteria bacterium]|nr:nuclear transport factor 2 family protein [Acidobacteriota bacterium]